MSTSRCPRSCQSGKPGKPDLEASLRLSLLIVACAILLIPSAANASPEDTDDLVLRAVAVGHTTQAYGVVKKVASLGGVKARPILPKLRLPDYDALTKKAWKVDRDLLRKQQWKSATAITFFEGKGKWLRATRHEKCWEVPWQRSCTAARASYRLHSELLRISTRRLLYELPQTNDWLTAIHIAQRAYPGTEPILRSLSDREGGWGRWVWYSGACSNPPCLWRGYHVGGDNVSGADTVGGWMQFRYSTFAPYWRAARADLKRRGFIIPLMQMPPEGGPVQYAAWLSPLGQALTAAYMHYSGKAGCHWCL